MDHSAAEDPIHEQGDGAAVDVGADLSEDRPGRDEVAADRLTGLVGDGDTDDS